MAPKTGSRDFITLFNTSAEDLISEKFYDAMDSDPQDIYNFNRYCNSIVVKSKYDEMIPICKKYQRFLYKCLAWSDLNPDFDVSLLLSYWLYEKLIKIYGDTNTKEITLGFSALQGTWANFFNYKGTEDPYYKKCKPELDLVDHEDWKKRKELYDYYIDYGYVSRMADVLDDKCKYYKIIEDKKALYDHFAQRCASGGGDCPYFYKKCEPYNPKDVLPNLYCHAKMQAAARTPDQSPGTRDTRAQNLGHEAGGDGSQFQEASASTEDTPSTSPSSDIKTNVANSVLGAAPVLLTATMLYRYTPLGPWIRRFGGGRTNSMNTMDTLSSYTEETVN